MESHKYGCGLAIPMTALLGDCSAPRGKRAEHRIGLSSISSKMKGAVCRAEGQGTVAGGGG